MAPLPFSGSLEETRKRLKQACHSIARLRLISEQDGYLHYEARSRFLGFVDDVEFLIDAEAGLIHFRSASRTGYSDLGANRTRMEAIGKEFKSSYTSHG